MGIIIGIDVGISTTKIVGIRDSDGRKVNLTRVENEDFVCFAKPGIYRIYLRTQSEAARTKEAVISFPVDASTN